MIRFITQPEIYIVGRLATDRKALRRFFRDNGFTGQVTAPDDAPAAEVPVTVGSRTCYQSFDNGREHGDHVRHVISVGHGSVLEHSVYSVLFAGISRSCGRELLRHRHLSPSELSQRYCDMSKVGFVVPPAELADWRVWSELRHRDTWDAGDHFDAARHGIEPPPTPDAAVRFATFVDLCIHSLNAYRDALEVAGPHPKKHHREAARSRLLESAETRILFTGNLRAYRNLFERRCSAAADAEIRRACCKLFDLMAAECPNVFADYTRTELGDGTFEVSTASRSI